jgi:hypothetical protein
VLRPPDYQRGDGRVQRCRQAAEGQQMSSTITTCLASSKPHGRRRKSAHLVLEFLCHAHTARYHFLRHVGYRRVPAAPLNPASADEISGATRMATVSGYDAFISYSRQHDHELAPALQDRLERFAKPWYRRRALRIFLDTADLSAIPALWPSVEDALGSSRWFILLASADAARSEWVNREVQWWLDHYSTDRLLVVATSPGLAWDEQQEDWVTDAPVPPALRGAFTHEPQWVDLSRLRLGSHKPLIPDIDVAAVAAPLRSVPQDMLIGEYLNAQRAIRLAVAAVAVLAILLALAVFGLIALGHSNPVASTLLLYSAIGLAFVIVGSLVPVIWSLIRRTLLTVRLGHAKIQVSEIRAAQPPKDAEDLGIFADEDLRWAEYNTERDEAKTERDEAKTERDEAERELGPYLPANLRGAKRLINHERLYVQIAEDRGIFGGDPKLTYRHLAKWVLIIEHWPRLGAALTRDPDKMEALESCTDIETLQQRLNLVDPNSRATDELLKVLSKAVPLSPILGRLVQFEPSETSFPRAGHPGSEKDG